MSSLRTRALLGGSVWAALIVFVGGFAIFSFFSNATQRQFDNALTSARLQLIVALGNSQGDPELIASFLSNPAYDRPYSGSYWQASGPDDVFLTSRSLFDAFLPDPLQFYVEPQFWEGEGPTEMVRGIHQLVELDDGSEWVVTVAQSVEGLVADQQRIRQSLFSALALIGLLGVAAAVLLASVIVRPLDKLREDVAHRWDSSTALHPEDYPEEVAPLVADINTLLNRNREIVDRARRQAADMAHALKTPSAILRNELEILSMEGARTVQAQDALARIDAQLLRSLARIRAANTGAGLAEMLSLKSSVDRLSRLFRKLHERDGGELTTAVDGDIKVPMDAQDLEEVIGNLVENAFNYGHGKVHISAIPKGDLAVLTVEDDGPGIPEDEREEAMRAGGRLDSGKPGTGLGLAIAADLLMAYGGVMALSQSTRLGGLRVKCEIPTKPISLGLSLRAAE